MNISSVEEVARLMKSIDQPARLQILLAIGEGETCVCHLEATFGWRQAYLSQHLMALREAGIVLARREGRFIHYRLANYFLLKVIHDMAAMVGTSLPELAPSPRCGCSNCRSKREENKNNSRETKSTRPSRADLHSAR